MRQHTRVRERAAEAPQLSISGTAHVLLHHDFLRSVLLELLVDLRAHAAGYGEGETVGDKILRGGM